ncbi:MAG TPA: hypothetical protein VJQ53_05390, partial [Candidatus Eisenbacteria bacterium]|nr:hypothetical protein [Candidatus Eisenbacteria bacterium]
WAFLMGLLGRWPRRYMMWFALVFFGLYGGYFVARLNYYRQWLPNTFYAKRGGGGILLHRGWKELIRDHGASAWLLIPLAIAAARKRMAATMLIGVVLLRIAFQLWSGGPSSGRYRFLVPVLPFLYVLIVAGLTSLVRSSAARRVAIGLAALAILVPGWLAYPNEREYALAYGRGERRAHMEFGRWVNTHTAGSAIIAMDDAGLGPLTADRECIDMLGLNDSHIAHLSGSFGGKMDARYVLGRRPDLIVLISTVPRATSGKDFELEGDAILFEDPEFGHLYRWCREYEFAPDYHLAVYRRIDSKAVPPDSSVAIRPNR